MNDFTNFDFSALDAVEQTEQIEPTTEQIIEKVTVKHLTDLFSTKNSLQQELFHVRQLLDSNMRVYEEHCKAIDAAEQRMLDNPFGIINNFNELKQYEAACLNRAISMMYAHQNRIRIPDLEESIDKVSKEIEQAIAQLKGGE